MLVSVDQEIAMGRQADAAVIATIGLYPDDAWQRYIQQLGARLAATSERPNLPWTFRVVDDPAINAFAIPGGFIYVTRGILAHLTSEAQLAAVVGHEIGHVTARHTAAQMSQQQLIGLGLAVGSMASSQVAKYASTANQALGILYLKFSRDNERQADQLGLRHGGAAIRSAQRCPGSRHARPRARRRARAAPRMARDAPQPGEPRRHDYYTDRGAAAGFLRDERQPRRLRMAAGGLVFGMNPRQGFSPAASSCTRICVSG
jgi:Zn-dependent protease with chaperone function